MLKTYYIETFGCQMNRGDSDLMAHSLEKAGLLPADDPGSAGVIIFNTCSVRAHAEQRALARIHETRTARRGGVPVIVVAGCMAQRLGRGLIDSGDADIVVGPYRDPAVGSIVSEYLERMGAREHLSMEPADFTSRIDFELASRKEDLPWHRWITITHGCGNFCSYCIVPYVRGPLISLPSESIVEYARLCAGNGVTEVTLLGQNVNQYGQDSGDVPFSSLLDSIAGIDGLVRVNFITSHPRDFSSDIVRVIRDHDNVSRSVHLPLQSGSDRILALMNRGYTLAHYMNIVETLDSLLDDYSLSTDLIVGFPGETEEEFRQTLRAVTDIRFDEAFTYAYSPREGTAAADLAEETGRGEKMARLQELIDTQRAVSADKLRTRVHRTEQVIVERMSKKTDGEVMGKSFLNHPVVLPGGPDDFGRKVSVIVTEVRGSTLFGRRSA